MRRTICSAAIATVVLAGAAAPAQAATAELRFDRNQALPPEPKGGSSGSIAIYHLIYTAEAGEANDLTVTGATGTVPPLPIGVRITDTGAPLSAGPGCHAEGAEVVCTISSGRIERSSYDAGDGNDKLRFANTAGNVQLGPGDDSITASHDSLTVPVINVDGGPGADTFGTGATSLLRVMYTSRSAPVSATPDGVANDGEAGEGDQLHLGVGAVDGGSGPDTLVGGATKDHLRGGAGDDTISGQTGDDALEGGEGSDRLDGGDGAESFAAEPGADIVRGGPGADAIRYYRPDDKRPVTVTLDDQPGDGVEGENDDVGSDVEGLTGGQGDDRLTGNDGPNRLVTEMGSDTADGRGGDDSLVASELGIARLTGGPGRDAFEGVGLFDRVDSADGVAEEIGCREEGIGPIDGDAADTGAGCIDGLRIPGDSLTRIRVDRRGIGRVRVLCGDIQTTCTGTLKLVAESARTRRGTGRVLARSKLRVSNNRNSLVRLRLSRRALRYLRARRRVTVTASFTAARTLPAETGTHKDNVRLVAPGR